MKMHPRTREVTAAKLAIAQEIESISDAHELTALELLQILTEHQQHVIKYALRYERHPDDPGKGADEE